MRRSARRVVLGAVSALSLVLGLSAAPALAHPPGDAIISNGTVQLGIHPQAHLNVPGPLSSAGTGPVGLRFVPTNNDGTGAGTPAEGWGVADASTGLTGHANEVRGEVINLTLVSFMATSTTAVSTVTVSGPGGQMLEVTHDYHPSPATPNLYEVTVTIKNIGTAAIGDLRYRRVMDWDVQPTAFHEYITIQTGTSANLLDNNNDGFATADPLGPDLSGHFDTSFRPLHTGSFTDAGPYDHGARFDFGFGGLAVGATRTFTIFYGAAATEAGAITAITAAGVEVYSFGQPNGGETTGAPNTFIFAFGGVGGAPIAPPTSLPQPTIVTSATSATVGQPIQDFAFLRSPSGPSGPLPTGTVTFTLFGPDNPTCSGTPVFTSANRPLSPIFSEGAATSEPFTPTAPGTYRWMASYSGDANYAPVISPCNAPDETSTVAPPTSLPQPTIVTSATSATVGQIVSDTATLSGGVTPTGTITFTLYGPADPTCAGAPTFTSTVPVAGNGSYTSTPPFAPPLVGTYQWVAVYSGDINNLRATSPCGAPSEQSVVQPTRPAITTTAPPTVPVGQAIRDTATLSGGFNPTGTITFSLFDGPTCLSPPVFTSTAPVDGNGAYTSGPFTPTAPGTYQWIASYSGDVNNLAATTACGDPNETTLVTGLADLSITKTCDSDPVVPGAVVFCSVAVSNAGPTAAQDVTVSDDLPDGMTLVGAPSGGGFSCGVGDPFTCTLATLGVGSSATFSFSSRIPESAAPGASFTNTATVSSPTPDLGPGPNTATAATSVVTCTITGAGDIFGTEGNDVICGSAGPDRIAALGGNDVIFGSGGDDQISAGGGDDLVFGGDGSDQLVGGGGNDTLLGNGGGVDRLSGGFGDDTLNTVDGSADDFVVGGEHAFGDTCVVDPGDGTYTCENGTTTPPTTTTTTVAAATTTTTTSTVAPTTTATVVPTTTTTVAPTSTTTTTATATPTTTTSTVGPTTTSTLPPTTASTVPPTNTSFPPTATTTTSPAQLACGGFRATIVGTSGDDTILGTPGPDVIVGGGGNDLIAGLGGDDVICGGSGIDQVFGGDGNDRIFGDDGSDQLSGGSGNDTIFGGAGDNRVIGGAGDDSLNGGPNADQCLGDDGTDTASGCESVLGLP